MNLTYGNLWDYYDQGSWIGVPTNGDVKANGRLVMGAGVAKQALERIPGLDKQIGDQVRSRSGLRAYGFISCRVVSFPTKYHWRDGSDLDLIAKSAEQLAGMLRMYYGITKEQPFVLPAPGCGLGGLTWREVELLLEPLEAYNLLVIMEKSK